MSRLCRLRNAKHGSDGQWAHNEIESLRQQLAAANDEIERLKQCHLEQMAAVQIRLAENKEQLAASQAREQLTALQSDPAIHFAHRFAVVLECMIHSEYPNEFWSEATLLLSEYHEANAQWREAMGEPYVSGFGKD